MRTSAAALCLLVLSVVASSQSWVPSIPNRAIYSVAVNPQNPSTVFAGNLARTFFRSFDGGSTWEEMYIENFGGASEIQVMMVHPADTNVVFAAGPGLDGLERSSDQGLTWETVLKSDDLSRFELGGSSALVVDPQTPSTMYALQFQNGNVYRSMNSGEQWELISTIPGLASTDRMRALTVHPDSSTVLLASGRRAHIMRSADAGVTWDSTDMSAMTLQRDEDVANFAWSPTTPGTVYATVQRSLFPLVNSAGLLRSTDDGQTWERWRFVDTSLYAIHVRGGFYGDDIWLGGNQTLFPSDSGYIRGDSLVFHTTNGGTDWQSFSNIPWMENEIGDVGANIWAIELLELPSIPEEVTYRLFLATDGGLFVREFMTSVSEAPEQPTRLPAVWAASGIVRFDPSFPAETYTVHDLQGAVVARGSVVKAGTLDLQQLPCAVYAVTITGTTTSINLLVQR